LKNNILRHDEFCLNSNDLSRRNFMTIFPEGNIGSRSIKVKVVVRSGEDCQTIIADCLSKSLIVSAGATQFVAVALTS